MKIRIVVEADLTGISKAVLEDLDGDLTEAIDQAVEGGEYYLTHPDTEREYDCDISVSKVTVETI